MQEPKAKQLPVSNYKMKFRSEISGSKLDDQTTQSPLRPLGKCHYKIPSFISNSEVTKPVN